MKNYIAIAVLALVFGLGSATQAQAQIVYGYTVPVYGGVESVATVASPYGNTTTTNFYSPFTGATVSQTSGFAGGYNGGYFNQVYGYNPLFGGSFGYSRVVPNTYLSPITNPFATYYNPYTGVTSYRRR